MRRLCVDLIYISFDPQGMPLNSRNLVLIFLPVALISALDLWLKKWIVAVQPAWEFLFFKINIVANKGIIGGYFAGMKPALQIPMITFGFFLLISLYFLQMFAPVRSRAFRIALSMFFGGVFANVLDRLLRGYVVDYVTLNFPFWSSPAFNLADVFQMIAIAILFVLQFRASTFDPEHGKTIWVSPQFQKRYSTLLLKMGFAVILLFGMLSYTFMKVALDEIALIEGIRAKLMQDYLIFFASSAAVFLLLLFLVGRIFSAYVVMPIKNFEHYLRHLASGDYGVFKVEEPEFTYLENLSDGVRDHIMDLHRQIHRLEARSKKNE